MEKRRFFFKSSQQWFTLFSRHVFYDGIPLISSTDEYPFPNRFFFFKHEWMNEKIVFDSFMYLFENVWMVFGLTWLSSFGLSIDCLKLVPMWSCSWNRLDLLIYCFELWKMFCYAIAGRKIYGWDREQVCLTWNQCAVCFRSAADESRAQTLDSIMCSRDIFLKRASNSPSFWKAFFDLISEFEDIGLVFLLVNDDVAGLVSEMNEFGCQLYVSGWLVL